MARIKGKDTGPERLLRAELWRRGLRYRFKTSELSVRPDLVFAGSRTVVFIDGCFWHGCPEHYVRPRSRPEFWSAKLLENVLRDHRQTLDLERMGWKVVRIWEHELFTDLPQVVKRVEETIEGKLGNQNPDWRVVRVEPLATGSDFEDRELVDLRDLSHKKSLQQKRSTKKW